MRVPSNVVSFLLDAAADLVVAGLDMEGFFRFHSARQWSNVRAYGLQVFDAVLDRPASRQSFKQFRYATVDTLQARLLISIRFDSMVGVFLGTIGLDCIVPGTTIG